MASFDFTTPGGRLNYLIKNLNITQSEFGNNIGLTKFEVSRLINNKKRLTPRILSLIKIQYPHINTSWLEHNIGSSGIEKDVRSAREMYYIEKISNLESENKRLKIELSYLKQPK